ARELGKRLFEGFKTLEEFPFVGDVRGLGMVFGVEIVSNKETKPADPALATKIFKAAQERGLRTRPLGNTLAFAPPLSINEKEADLARQEILEILGLVVLRIKSETVEKNLSMGLALIRDSVRLISQNKTQIIRSPFMREGEGM